MINITLPDNSVRTYAEGATSLDIAKSISEGLARNVLSATVNGEVWDLSRPIYQDATLRLHTWEHEEGKATMWHSSAHLMAEAVEFFYPGVKFGIGPDIENGFYYDIDFVNYAISSDDFKKIEDKMLEIAQKKIPFRRKDITKAEALAYFRNKNDEYNQNPYVMDSYLENPTFRLPDYPLGSDYYNNDESYSLTLITTNDYGCDDSISKDYLYKGLFVPSAFAPESFDPDLRIFQPQGKGLLSYDIKVYDKYGNVLWSSTELQNGWGEVGEGEDYSHPGPGWDGRYKGEFVPIGTYVWKVNAVFKDGSLWEGNNAGEDKNLSGTVCGVVVVVR